MFFYIALLLLLTLGMQEAQMHMRMEQHISYINTLLQKLFFILDFKAQISSQCIRTADKHCLIMKLLTFWPKYYLGAQYHRDHLTLFCRNQLLWMKMQSTAVARLLSSTLLTFSYFISWNLLGSKIFKVCNLSPIGSHFGNLGPREKNCNQPI